MFKKNFKSQMDPSTRENLLRHAKKIFAQSGFKETTIRQICKSAKVNICLVSYYFGGKDGLYQAVLQNIVDEKFQIAQKHLANPQSETKEEYRVRLNVFLESMFHDHIIDFDSFKVIHREIMEGLPRAADNLGPALSRSRKILIEYIEYGLKKKFLKKGLDAHITSQTAVNVIMGFVAQLSLGKKEMFYPNFNEKELPEKIIKTFIPIFLDGVINNENTK